MATVIDFILLGLWWYLSFLCNAFAGKVLHSKGSDASFPPVVLACLQCLTGTLGPILFGKIGLATLTSKLKSASNCLPLIFLMGVGHLVGNLGTNIGLSMITISVVHTIKAAEPLVSAYLGVRYLREPLSPMLLVSTVILSAGVVMASIHHTSSGTIGWMGYAAALISNVAFAMRNLQMKLLHKDSALNEFEMFFLMSLIASVLSACSLLTPPSNAPASYSTTDLFYACCFHYFYNTFSFILLGRISLLSHAISNTFKRLFLVLSTALFFHHVSKALTPLNLAGSVIACFGAGLFGISKSLNAAAHSKPTSMQGDKGVLRANAAFIGCVLLLAAMASLSLQQPTSAPLTTSSRAQHVVSVDSIHEPKFTANDITVSDTTPQTTTSHTSTGATKQTSISTSTVLQTTSSSSTTRSATNANLVLSKKLVKKVLIFTGHGNYNLGDDEQPWAWLESVEALQLNWDLYFATLPADSPEPDVIPNPAEICKKYMPQSLFLRQYEESFVFPFCIGKTPSQEAVSAIQDFDGFLVGGGGLLAITDYAKLLTNSHFLSAVSAKRPLYIVGIGCFFPMVMAFSNLIDAAQEISVRDDESHLMIRKFSKSFGPSHHNAPAQLSMRLRKGYDPILASPASALPPSLGFKGASVTSDLRVCWNLKVLPEHTDYFKKILRMRKNHMHDSLVVVSEEELQNLDSLIPNASVIFGERIYRYRGENATIVALARFFQAHCDLVFGMTLHGTITALKAGLPVYGFRAGKIEGSMTHVLGSSISKCYDIRQIPNLDILKRCLETYTAERAVFNERLLLIQSNFSVVLRSFDARIRLTL